MPSSEYSREERNWLLQLAHDAILSALERRTFSPEPLNAHVANPSGAFTSLHIEGALRGCVGFITARTPLYQTVVESARAAAFEDNRFESVTLQEAPFLEIEISVLSPIEPIRADQVEVGRHGLVISSGYRRGLLLPQVPVEHGWNRITFLEQTCRKAGLSPDAWHSGAQLEAFTAEVFGNSRHQTM